ncbi:hypothetical protein E3N88_14480 [Mikania micrantha]|uniref:Uncharacterized protein n=1 Tax=Mikania micrantha TaxID=192012 RepID=A0A5N6P1J0_9ASTR|nr:hypothetical protein E3N88_14480 [Mikania micrantha]
MMNVSENRARNGVTDFPESRNEVFVEKWEKWFRRYAKEWLRVLRGTRRRKISAISPKSFAVREAFLVPRRVTTITVSKVLIRELYLVNPCAAEQEPLIVLLADNPFAGRIASPLVNGDITVRMHVTLM